MIIDHPAMPGPPALRDRRLARRRRSGSRIGDEARGIRGRAPALPAARRGPSSSRGVPSGNPPRRTPASASWRGAGAWSEPWISDRSAACRPAPRLQVGRPPPSVSSTRSESPFTRHTELAVLLDRLVIRFRSDREVHLVDDRMLGAAKCDVVDCPSRGASWRRAPSVMRCRSRPCPSAVEVRRRVDRRIQSEQFLTSERGCSTPTWLQRIRSPRQVGGDEASPSAKSDRRSPPSSHPVLGQRAGLVRVQMMVADPIVSHATSCRTREFARVIFRIDSASDTVTLMGSPSGTATTTMITIVTKWSSNSPADRRAPGRFRRRPEGLALAAMPRIELGDEDERRRPVADPADRPRERRQLLLQGRSLLRDCRSFCSMRSPAFGRRRRQSCLASWLISVLSLTSVTSIVSSLSTTIPWPLTLPVFVLSTDQLAGRLRPRR